jgi:hypothetical protein
LIKIERIIERTVSRILARLVEEHDARERSLAQFAVQVPICLEHVIIASAAEIGA